MSKVKIFALAVSAALALSAMGASSALAEHMWWVNGTLLPANASAAIPFQLPKIDLSLILHFSTSGAAFLILCNNVHLSGKIYGLDKILLKLIFLLCHTISPTPTKCELEGQQTGALPTIETVSLLGLARLARVSGGPSTGKLITEIPFASGTSCVLEGSIPVKGEATIGTPTGAEEREEQAAVGLGSEENNSLEIGSGNKGFLLGKILVKLNPGETWSFHP